MPEKFIEKLSGAVGRRSFLRTLSGAAAALALSLFNVAHAGGCGPSLFKVGCCCLFKDPRSCSYSGCACEWSWTCTDNVECRRYTCKECYSTGETDGSGTCIGTVKCSKAMYQSLPSYQCYGYL